MGERRAFGRYAAGLLAFLAPVLAAGAIAEAVLPRLENEHHGFRTKAHAMAERAPRLELLALGSSHAYLGLDPAAFPMPGYNLAYHDQSLHYDAALVSRYLPQLPRLRLVLFGVSYFSLRASSTSQAFFYERAFGLPAPFGWWYPQHYSDIAMYGSPEATKMLLKAALRRPLVTKLTADGWFRADEAKAAVSPLAIRQRLAEHEGWMRAGATAANLADLRAALAVLKARGVRAAFVGYPERPEYVALRDPAAVSETRGAIAELSAAYGAPFLDHTTDPRFTPADFSDADHLAAGGAAKLSALVAREAAARGLYAKGS